MSGTANAAPDVRPRSGWLRMQSPNFLLVGDVSARDLRQVAERLEQFRDALGILLPKATRQRRRRRPSSSSSRTKATSH